MKETNIYDIIRINIKKIRQEKGLTQAQLAEKTDLSHDYIRQIESLKVANTFSVDTLYRIAKALDTDISKLFKEWLINNHSFHFHYDLIILYLRY